MPDKLETERLTSDQQINANDQTEIEIDLAQPSAESDARASASASADSSADLDSESAENEDADATLAKRVALARFDLTLEQVRKREEQRQASKSIWLSHHWPDDYAKKCAKIGGRHVCRRCAALYPLGFIVAALSVAGMPLWSNSLDPALIWLLCLPASMAFTGEAIGLFTYSPRWQVGTMLIAALAFGKALGYELDERWSPEFWWPIAIFGGLWFLASVFSAKTAPIRQATATTDSAAE